jgi:hypothetical protein
MGYGRRTYFPAIVPHTVTHLQPHAKHINAMIMQNSRVYYLPESVESMYRKLWLIIFSQPAWRLHSRDAKSSMSPHPPNYVQGADFNLLYSVLMRGLELDNFVPENGDTRSTQGWEYLIESFAASEVAGCRLPSQSIPLALPV